MLLTCDPRAKPFLAFPGRKPRSTTLALCSVSTETSLVVGTAAKTGRLHQGPKSGWTDDSLALFGHLTMSNFCGLCFRTCPFYIFLLWRVWDHCFSFAFEFFGILLFLFFFALFSRFLAIVVSTSPTSLSFRGRWSHPSTKFHCCAWRWSCRRRSKHVMLRMRCACCKSSNACHKIVISCVHICTLHAACCICFFIWSVNATEAKTSAKLFVAFAAWIWPSAKVNVEIQTQKHVKTIGDLFDLVMILKLDVEQALALFCFDFWLLLTTFDYFWLLLTARSLRLRKVAATEITGWRRVEHQSRGKAGDRVLKCGFFRTLAKFRAEWRNNGKIPWNHKIGWDPHRRIIGIIGQTGEIFGTSVSQVADLQLLVRCSRHKTPAAWLHTVAHRWDDTEMTQRWDNIRTTSEQHGNTGFARSLPPNLQFPRCFHSFKLRLYMYLINSNIDII